ncbi:tetratricopeptide repeat-containing diguanylate cyclase [Ferrimonas senticii]|uniref:tetratricopeptide repeat-containing diguanylate cyclase n=1 Tax=Ferrimonas senticii TaxID=394566 RepID=UPI0004069006|nr:tetratricopeptide repeat-containing diguanylate cyclase [Ferrimonas senticii]
MATATDLNRLSVPYWRLSSCSHRVAALLPAALSLWLLSTTAVHAITTEQLHQLEQLRHQDRPQTLIQTAHYLEQSSLSVEQRLTLLDIRCNALLDQSRYADVEQLYQDSLPMLDSLAYNGFWLALGACYGSALDREGRTQTAMMLFEQLQAQFDPSRYPYQYSLLLSAKANLHGYRGEYQASVTALNHAIKLLHQSGRDAPQQMMQLRNSMANNYKYMGLYDKAEQSYLQILAWLEQTDDHLSTAVVLYNIASMHEAQSEYDQSKLWAQRSKQLAQQVDDQIGVAYANVLIASADAAAGHYQQALQLAEHTTVIFDRFNEIDGAAALRLKAASWYNQLQDYQAALAQAEAAQRLYLQSGSLTGQAKTAKVLAEIYLNQGELNRVIALTQLQIALNQQAFDTDLNNQIAAMQAKFQVNQDAIEKQLLDYRYQAQQAQLQKRNWQLTSGITIVVSLLLCVILLLWLLNRSNKLSKKLEHSAHHDALTGLYNRRYIRHQLTQELARYQRHQQPFCIALVDVDNFKNINDQFGHSQGDQVLTALAELFLRHLRQNDLCARYGGEEFLLLMPHTSLQEAEIVLERLRQDVATMQISGLTQLTISGGYAQIRHQQDIDSLITCADSALYQAKFAGRNRCIAARDGNCGSNK